MNITIYNPDTKEELHIQESLEGLAVYKIGEYIQEKYPNFLIKNIWQ